MLHSLQSLHPTALAARRDTLRREAREPGTPWARQAWSHIKADCREAQRLALAPWTAAPANPIDPAVQLAAHPEVQRFFGVRESLAPAPDAPANYLEAAGLAVLQLAKNLVAGSAAVLLGPAVGLCRLLSLWARTPTLTNALSPEDRVDRLQRQYFLDETVMKAETVQALPRAAVAFGAESRLQHLDEGWRAKVLDEVAPAKFARLVDPALLGLATAETPAAALHAALAEGRIALAYDVHVPVLRQPYHEPDVDLCLKAWIAAPHHRPWFGAPTGDVAQAVKVDALLTLSQPLSPTAPANVRVRSVDVASV